MIKNIEALENHGNTKLRPQLLKLADLLLKEIDAYKIVKENVKKEGYKLIVKEKIFSLNSKRIFVVGFGKASLPMAKAIYEKLGNRIEGGIINTPFPGKVDDFKVNVLSHPFPDERTVKYSRELVNFVGELGKDDLLIVLLSGGASALFEIPKGDVSIEEETEIVRTMMNRGADIFELNAIRMALSSVKGGKFLKYAYPVKVISLILSDVIGHPKWVGSGPTYPQSYSIEKIVEKYGLQIKTYDLKVREKLMKDIKKADVHNILLADNRYALEKGKMMGEKMKLKVRVFPDFLKGEPRDAHRRILETMKGDFSLFIFGGETRVNVAKTYGLGGRNQELSLYLAGKMEPNTSFLCMGTDGIDGPTDAAGGIVDDTTYERAENLGIDIGLELRNHNSYGVLKKLGDLIFTGYTGTNLADVCIGLHEKTIKHL